MTGGEAWPRLAAAEALAARKLDQRRRVDVGHLVKNG